MKIVACRFECSAYRAEDEPRSAGPIVVFLGRSNVGKSSLINRLLGSPGLARTSSTPGRTQSVNFYRVNDSLHFVDLPGYGYSAAPERIRLTWRGMVEGFLDRWGRRIAVAVLLVDARRVPTELDAVMREWVLEARLPHEVVATKADKLSASERARIVGDLRRWVGASGGEAPLLVSARTGLGVRELWKRLDRALSPALRGDRGSEWTSAN